MKPLKQASLPKLKMPKLPKLKSLRLTGTGMPKMPRVFGSKKK